MIPTIRTALAAILVAVIALRWSLSQPVSAVTARIAVDPWEAVRSAGSGWTFAGTLGGSTVDGLRELPYALVLALGTDAGVAAHTVETCWRMLVLVVAVVGAVRLARTQAARDASWAPWAGALVFVLASVLLPATVRSPNDGLAAATLPWIVAPLLVRRGGWRSAAGSAVWLGLAGIGAAGWALAALAVGILAAVPRRRADVGLAVRWSVLAIAASAWWLVALVWEARHTVDVSALSAGALRAEAAAVIGRPDVAALVLVAIVAGPFVVAGGALLLNSPRLERFFVAGSLVLVAAVGLLGWAGDWRPHVPAPVAGDLPAGLAAPLLGVLGLAGLVAWCPLVADLAGRVVWARQERLPHGRRELAGAVAALLVGVTVFAGLAAAVAEPEPEDPTSARLVDAVADWSATAPPGRVLVLPVDTESSELSSIGGALGARPWIGRDTVPTSGAGGTAALDDLIARLGRGDAGQGTTSALRRLGVSYLLVRLGGPDAEDRARPTALVRSALDTLGARRVAVLRGTDAVADGPGTVVDYGVRSAIPLVEVWAAPPTADGWVYAGGPIDAVGDAGTVSDLAETGVLGDRAVRLRAGSSDSAVLVSDSARRRDVDQRRADDPYGPDLRAHEPRSVLPADAAPVTSAVSRLDGALAVAASSSAADLESSDRDPGTAATAGIDDNVFTSWQSRRGRGVGEWWQVDFARPTSLSGATITMLSSSVGGGEADQVRVTADGRDSTHVVGDDGLVEIGGLGDVRRLRITIEAVTESFDDGDSVGIVEVTIPDVVVTAPLVLDETPAAGWLMALRPASTTHCVPAAPHGDDDGPAPGTACNADLEVSGPDAGLLDRVLHAPRLTPVAGRAWLTASSTDQAGALADSIAEPSVTASSTSVAAADLRTRPQAAADADLRTAWRAAPGDAQPQLRLEWEEPADVSGVRLIPPAADLGSEATRVRVTAQVIGRRTELPIRDLETEVEVEDDGTIDLPRVHVSGLTITVLEDTGVSSIDSTTGVSRQMPVAVGEVDLLGGPGVTYKSHRSKRIGCDDGPTLTVNGQEYGTTMRVTPSEIVSGVPVPATVCGRPELAAGHNQVALSTTFAWWARGLLLSATSSGLADGGAPTAVDAELLGPDGPADSVALDLGSAAAMRTLVLPMPAGSGWEASVDGEDLDAVTIDGWAQGWVVPAGSGEVTVRYASGAELARAALVASTGWALVVLLLAGFGVAAVVSAIRRPRSRRR